MRRLGTQLVAIVRQRCPRCHQGPAFRTLLAMHEACLVCAYRWAREPGYFVGAMYVSYTLAVLAYLAAAGTVRLACPGWSDEAVLAAAVPLFLPLVPVLFRYSRVIWLHLGFAVDGARTGWR